MDLPLPDTDYMLFTSVGLAPRPIQIIQLTAASNRGSGQRARGTACVSANLSRARDTSRLCKLERERGLRKVGVRSLSQWEHPYGYGKEQSNMSISHEFKLMS